MEIAFHRPGKNYFAAGLLETAKLNERAMRKGTSLFLKFPFGSGEGAFVPFD